MAFDDLSCSADIGRANPQEKVYKPAIRCPQVSFNRKAVNRETMTERSCKLRIIEGNECSLKCEVAHAIVLKFILNRARSLGTIGPQFIQTLVHLVQCGSG